MVFQSPLPPGCPEGAGEGSAWQMPAPCAFPYPHPSPSPGGKGSRLRPAQRHHAQQRPQHEKHQYAVDQMDDHVGQLERPGIAAACIPVQRERDRGQRACRKLAGEDRAAFTHAARVECPGVMWIAASSTMLGNRRTPSRRSGRASTRWRSRPRRAQAKATAAISSCFHSGASVRSRLRKSRHGSETAPVEPRLRQIRRRMHDSRRVSGIVASGS